MAYSELIKSFAKIRDYVNQFYVYGFRTRLEYTQKSARSYDNERRRIESWLGDYISFNQDSNGKNVYLSVDSRAVPHNPLYKAFKAKSFTDNDITLHFYILDILSDSKMHTINDIVNQITEKYCSFFEKEKIFDESTIRKKLNEYSRLGLIKKQKQGKMLYYTISDNPIDLDKWKDAIAFFSEADELGVIGSYLLDKYDAIPDYYAFKHHYILYALESEILYSILTAINEHRRINIECYFAKRRNIAACDVLPVKIYVSTQGGRRHLFCYNRKGEPLTLRMDAIKKVTVGDMEPFFESYIEKYNNFKDKIWGVSFNGKNHTEHIEMIIYVGENEEYIANRLEREKRCGTVSRIDNNHYLFSADVYDANEMLPWLRTFIGRIDMLECSNKKITKTFYSDLEKMKAMYKGDFDDIQ